MNKSIIIGIVAGFVFLLLIAGAVVGTLYFTGNLSGPKAAGAPEASAKAAAAHGQPAEALIYVTMDPPLTMSFPGSSSVHYLQFALNVAVEDKAVEEAVKAHDPAIRNALVMLLSNQKAETLQTREGKEQLRIQIRDEIRNTLKEITGKTGIADVYFTSFVMQ
jgi:flagellar FliL protein